jgi:hypothetical protein
MQTQHNSIKRTVHITRNSFSTLRIFLSILMKLYKMFVSGLMFKCSLIICCANSSFNMATYLIYMDYNNNNFCTLILFFWGTKLEYLWPSSFLSVWAHRIVYMVWCRKRDRITTANKPSSMNWNAVMWSFWVSSERMYICLYSVAVLSRPQFWRKQNPFMSGRNQPNGCLPNFMSL